MWRLHIPSPHSYLQPKLLRVPLPLHSFMAIFNSAQNLVFSFLLLSPVFYSFCLFLLHSVVKNKPSSSQLEDSKLCSCHLQHNDPLSPSLPRSPNSLPLFLSLKRTTSCGAGREEDTVLWGVSDLLLAVPLCAPLQPHFCKFHQLPF